jgi:hydrogenase nickel incorporation protein HypA/HybF
MHEFSVAQALVDEVARALGGRTGRVTEVRVAVGALSGVDPQALAFAFPAAADGTAAGGARLVLQNMPAEVACRACGRRTAADPTDLRCGACGSDAVDVAGGQDLVLRAIELEEPDHV